MVWQPEQPLVEKTNRPGSGAGVNTKVGPTAKVGSSPSGGGVGVGFPQAKRRQTAGKGINARNLFMFQRAPLNRLPYLWRVFCCYRDMPDFGHQAERGWRSANGVKNGYIDVCHNPHFP